MLDLNKNTLLQIYDDFHYVHANAQWAYIYYSYSYYIYLQFYVILIEDIRINVYLKIYSIIKFITRTIQKLIRIGIGIFITTFSM